MHFHYSFLLSLISSITLAAPATYNKFHARGNDAIHPPPSISGRSRSVQSLGAQNEQVKDDDVRALESHRSAWKEKCKTLTRTPLENYHKKGRSPSQLAKNVEAIGDATFLNAFYRGTTFEMDAQSEIAIIGIIGELCHGRNLWYREQVLWKRWNALEGREVQYQLRLHGPPELQRGTKRKSSESGPNSNTKQQRIENPSTAQKSRASSIHGTEISSNHSKNPTAEANENQHSGSTENIECHECLRLGRACGDYFPKTCSRCSYLQKNCVYNGIPAQPEPKLQTTRKKLTKNEMGRGTFALNGYNWAFDWRKNYNIKDMGKTTPRPNPMALSEMMN